MCVLDCFDCACLRVCLVVHSGLIHARTHRTACRNKYASVRELFPDVHWLRHVCVLVLVLVIVHVILLVCVHKAPLALKISVI